MILKPQLGDIVPLIQTNAILEIRLPHLNWLQAELQIIDICSVLVLQLIKTSESLFSFLRPKKCLMNHLHWMPRATNVTN